MTFYGNHPHPDKFYIKLGLSEDEFKNKLHDLSVIQGISCVKIGKIFSVSSVAIYNYIKLYGYERRKELRSKEWLYKEYVENNRTQISISKELNVTSAAINSYLKKFNIPIKTLKEAQAIRVDTNNRRSCPNNSTTKFTGPFGYCFWYNDIYCASTAEYIFLKKEKELWTSIEPQPFVFNNRRPDFLLNKNIVLEIKDQRRSVNKEKECSYFKYGKEIEKEFGFTYQLRYMYSEYTTDYRKALKWLNKNATRGCPFTLLEDI